MAGLVPAIHVFVLRERKTWMPGTSQDKPGHDEYYFLNPSTGASRSITYTDPSAVRCA
jgi:hypothetical protein